ncbi:recombinase family protein [uncultured Alistipes sp.]|jgi:DNA resolvase|uniref:recombinase family protein n=1 Tax=uncultured Alistipes sp. TaxID=538949 RepID=UPI0025D53D09|nr:recombinase family protein [uncultured Alistipes sp.]
MRIVGYCRVSTASQSTDRQIAELNEYASRNGHELVRVFAEQISGAVKNENRPQLSAMIEFVTSASEIDKIVVWELSRLGRNTLEVLKTIETLNQNKINLHVLTTNMETLDSKGEINPVTRLILTIMSELGAMERKQIRDRMSSGYQHHLAQGGSVGRKVGYRKSEETMRSEYKEVIKCLRKGISIEKAAKICDVSKSTVQRVKKMI